MGSFGPCSPAESAARILCYRSGPGQWWYVWKWGPVTPQRAFFVWMNSQIFSFWPHFTEILYFFKTSPATSIRWKLPSNHRLVINLMICNSLKQTLILNLVVRMSWIELITLDLGPSFIEGNLSWKNSCEVDASQSLKHPSFSFEEFSR